jgi:hypothetical protein
MSLLTLSSCGHAVCIEKTIEPRACISVLIVSLAAVHYQRLLAASILDRFALTGGLTDGILIVVAAQGEWWNGRHAGLRNQCRKA